MWRKKPKEDPLIERLKLIGVLAILFGSGLAIPVLVKIIQWYNNLPP